ncbi:hypothetical protein ElyMa_001146800 [Elysia marginata]|uniref:Uncharacterized protein n=1 Tax=Elysia marginata TaxID=1093978 RepID=A0AAV4HZD8_9GAST|nr:hypothetical protein ElyMa_001146800 [Elysia marginata]
MKRSASRSCSTHATHMSKKLYGNLSDLKLTSKLNKPIGRSFWRTRRRKEEEEEEEGEEEEGGGGRGEEIREEEEISVYSFQQHHQISTSSYN